MTKETDTWIPFSWHCPNCGSIVTGFQNKKGMVKVECRMCHTVMVRTVKGKQKNTIALFPPKDLELDL